MTPTDLTNRIFCSLERRSWVSIFLIAILLVGWDIRLVGLNWDQGHGAHPDERYITWVASSISFPDRLDEVFDPQQTSLSPYTWPLANEGSTTKNGNLAVETLGRTRQFSYGHFPLYLMALVSGGETDEARLTLVGRVLSALFDTATILLVFALGRLLFGTAVGILAAVFVTFTVMHIQQAHFATVDATLAFFVTATLLFAVRFGRLGRRRDALTAGLCLGLAVGTKFNASLLLAPLAVALMLRRETLGDRSTGMLAITVLGLLIALVAFASTNPFSLIQAGEFVANLTQQGAMLRGDENFPFVLQYQGTWPYLYPIEQQLRWGMGFPLGLVALCGVGYVLFCVLRSRGQMETWILLTWLVVYFGFYGSLHVKFMRYMLPLSPVLAVLGAAVLVDGAGRARFSGGVGSVASRLRGFTPVRARTGNIRPTMRATLTGGAVGLVILATVFYALGFLNVYRGHHPWLSFSRWVYRQVPAGANVLHESWDHQLPLTLVDEEAMWWPGVYENHSIDVYAPDTPQKLSELLAQLAAGDYLIIASNRLYGSTVRAPDRYPSTARYYELLFDGRLGYELVPMHDIERLPRLGSIALVDDPFQAAGLPSPRGDGQEPAAPLELMLGPADESFTVYDHPQPMLFRNAARLSPEEMAQLFVDQSHRNVPLQ